LSHIAAVVVTYGATLAQVRRLLGSIEPQVKHVILVDNGSPSLKNLRNNSRLDVIRLQKNYGLAYAQNIGVERAIKLRADHVLFLDQDSVPYPDMVGRLERGLRDAKGQGIRVAAAGPVTEDSILGTRGFFLKTFLGVPYKSHALPQANSSFTRVHFVLSSGSLVPIEVLRLVGGQRGDYFIDHLDTEWAMRAHALGFSFVIANQALMEHRVGEAVRRFWLFGTRTIFLHQPHRYYYMCRNSFLMIYDNPINLWQLQHMLRLLKLFFYFSLFNNGVWRYLLRGIGDGLLNRRGMLDPKTLRLHAIPKTSVDPG
jgi:rhamnosyltransferase